MTLTEAPPRPAPLSGAERMLRACRREAVDVTPVWFMRQAGGQLPRYLALRDRHSVEEIARDPEMCAQVTVMPVEEYSVDAAVMFADITLPFAPMGKELRLTPDGPIIDRPVRSRRDVEALRRFDAAEDLRFVTDAIGLVRERLDSRAAVIGLAGGPFTLAAYLVEGSASRDQAVAKGFMFRERDAWSALMDLLAQTTIDYLRAQVRAGAQVIQLFDSWAGTLGPVDYRRFVLPWTRRILAALDGVPTIHFVARSAGILEEVAAAGGAVIGVDAGQSLASAWARIGPDRAVQGNLEPARLLAGWDAIEAGARAVLREAGGRPGHIFNVGHAIPRETDPAVLRELVAFLHAGAPA